MIPELAPKSDAWHAERRKGIGGSDAGRIMAGDWWALWAEKTGRAEPEDLSRKLAVQLGIFTEAFNAHWYELMTGCAVTARGLMMVHPKHLWMRCTLDGLVALPAGCDAVWQAKHVSGRSPVEEVVARYTPQVTHEMLVCGLDRAVLSLLIGTDKFEAVEIPLDEFYGAELIDREREFWSYVESDREPPGAPALSAPVPPPKYRKVDMSTSNSWADLAAAWLVNKAPAAAFKKAEAELKAMVEPDVGEATGHGIVAKRDKRGLSIKEVK
jgi:predicted phage-related endonuclease